jgi:hypothetical protein
MVLRDDGMDRRPMSCVEGCKLLKVTGVLTLDEDGRLQYFCDQCLLYPMAEMHASGSHVHDTIVDEDERPFHA